MKDNKFLRYPSSDNKMKHSKFDMSLDVLDSQNFGELKVVHSQEVLSGDKVAGGVNSLAKVATLKSPAFTKIKQNFYSFYNKSSDLWKHFNDWFSNGTEFMDTYGSNANNQKLNNPWRIPQIPVNDLQVITKIGKGFALPVWKFNSSMISAFNQFLDNEFNQSGWLMPSVRYALCDTSDHILHNRIFSVILQILKFRAPNSHIIELFKNIPYYEASFSVSDLEVAGVDFKVFKLQGLLLGCSVQVITELTNYLLDEQITGYDNGNNFKPIKEIPYNLFSGQNQPIAFRLFSDEVSNDLYNNHPFSLVKENSIVNGTSDSSNPSYYGHNINVFQFQKHINNVVKSTRRIKFEVDNVDVYCDLSVEQNNFYKRSCGPVIKASDGSTLFWLINGIPCLDENESVEISDVEFVFGYGVDEYLSLFCGIGENLTRMNTYNLTYQDVAPYSYKNIIFNDTQLYNQNKYDSVGVNCRMTPFSFYRTYTNLEVATCKAVADTDITEATVVPLLPCDYIISFTPYINNDTTTPFYLYVPTNYMYVNEVSISLGYDLCSLIVYLAMSATRLLSSFIPIEGFTSRGYNPYAQEFINALPFFNYSKVWNDVFRNKTVSSAELDFTETNSVAFLDEIRLAYIKSVYGSDMLSWLKELDQDDNVNSWVIPFCATPKSGIDRVNADNHVYSSVYNDVKNELHYLNLRSSDDLFHILTGFDLNYHVAHICWKPESYVSDDGGTTLDTNIFGIILDKFYLPNYYNGLLHQKFQNFNRDYFTGALLDPQTNANEVEVPDTISELYKNQIKQSFWQRSAVARSVRGWYEKLIGTSPVIDHHDTKMLGTAHSPVNIGEILQTSETNFTPQGYRTGVASSRTNNGLISDHFEQHGYILILSSFTLELQYMQGLSKQFMPYESFLDYPYSQFSELGNESILQKELSFEAEKSSHLKQYDTIAGIDFPYNVATENIKLFYNGASNPGLYVNNLTKSYNNIVPNDNTYTNLNSIFGFVPRFTNYKFNFDKCNGAFRESMKFWNTFRKFFTQPVLCHEFVNWEFVADNDEFNNLFAVTDDQNGDKFYCNTFINLVIDRLLPYFSKPKGV